MKKVFTIFLLCISVCGYSQASNEARDPLNQTLYSAELVAPNSEIVISVYKTATILEKTLILKTTTKKCKDKNGIVLKLSNGETLKFKHVVLYCDPSSPYSCNLKGSIPLTQDLYDKLSQVEITEFKLGRTKVPVVYNDKNVNLKSLFKFSEQH